MLANLNSIKSTACSAACLINVCKNIAHATNCQAPSTTFKSRADGTGFNNMNFRGGDMVNEGADAFKLLMARSQPIKLKYHYPIRRMMT